MEESELIALLDSAYARIYEVSKEISEVRACLRPLMEEREFQRRIGQADAPEGRMLIKEINTLQARLPALLAAQRAAEGEPWAISQLMEELGFARPSSFGCDNGHTSRMTGSRCRFCGAESRARFSGLSWD